MQPNLAHSCSPDPFITAAVRAPKALPRPRSVEEQRYRRSEILATCRRILAEDSFDGFTIRRVADECLVTPQTIHNCFGSRSDLLASTLNEYTSMMYATARLNSTCVTFFLELADSYCSTALRYPTFTREMMAAAFSARRPLLGQLRNYGQELRRLWRAEVAATQCFREEVDSVSFGDQVCQITSCMMFEWAVGSVELERMRAQMLRSLCDKLDGALKSEFLAEPDAWMKQRLHS